MFKNNRSNFVILSIEWSSKYVGGNGISIVGIVNGQKPNRGSFLSRNHLSSVSGRYCSLNQTETASLVVTISAQ
jgi:hypothetical protein